MSGSFHHSPTFHSFVLIQWTSLKDVRCGCGALLLFLKSLNVPSTMGYFQQPKLCRAKS